MTKYQGENRRKPVAGIKRDTYTEIAKDAGLSPAFGEATYDMIADIHSLMESGFKSLHDEVTTCNSMYVKKAHPKVPLSWPWVIITFAGIFIMIGYGYLEPDKIPKIFKAILPFI